MRRKAQSSFLVLSLLLVTASSFSQLPDFAKVPYLGPGDSVNITNLLQAAVPIKRKRIIAWFPKDSLSQTQMDTIADTLNIGVMAAERYIEAPYSWQAQSIKAPYTFYFRRDRFISHASGAGFVSIPFLLIRRGRSPWLHEAVHEILNSKEGSWYSSSITEKDQNENLPDWLFEGLPEYITIEVSKRMHLSKFDFYNTNSLNIDSICRSDLKSPGAEYILSFIGRKGVLPELATKERQLYAPVFYHASCSFTKYLADTYGLKVLLKSISSFRHELEVLEKCTGHSLEELRTAWLKKLNDQDTLFGK